MNSDFVYKWGETVRIALSAPREFRPGQVCAICGMRKEGEINLYLVEFTNGDSLEVPEDWLHPHVDESR